MTVDLRRRIDRDLRNAAEARDKAAEELRQFAHRPAVDFVRGTTEFSRDRTLHKMNERTSLEAISKSAFQAMAEVETETRDGESNDQLWYANEHSTANIVLKGRNGNRISVLSWTHPGMQIALSEDLNSYHDISSGRYALTGVSPKARARFKKLFPVMSGMYEPGGSVGKEEVRPAEAGLKSVKLDMTKEQVRAFISKMSGIMFVTGAPGSGKTTVALQRVRFLFDQKGLRLDDPRLVDYSPENTRIFLANPNLFEYTRELLKAQLAIPLDVVEMVSEFVSRYLGDVWKYKHNARSVAKTYPSRIDQRGREAFFSLCLASDLQKCWRYYEQQIGERLARASKAGWRSAGADLGQNAKRAVATLADTLSGLGSSRSLSKKLTDPLLSSLRMDKIFNKCRPAYEQVRESLQGKAKEKFDSDFLRWIFYVYDPLECLHSYFKDHTHEGEIRIKEGTGAKADGNKVIEEILDGWSKRIYGKEEEAWLAWLLRFALPEQTEPERRFREVPPGTIPVSTRSYGNWTHIVIDEAQDLSVPEASLLCSFVDPKGALTVSADFNQVVSPVHGMPNPEAIKYGCPIVDRAEDLQFPFTRNMRQTKQITSFLRAFYNNTFKQPPPFVANDALEDIKPQLHICRSFDFPSRIRQILAVLKKSKDIRTIALLQVNEDYEELLWLRTLLADERIPMATIWSPYGEPGQLVTTSVEKVKGLEYDCCLIMGLDNVEHSYLKYTVNRAYVAISRPARRLAIFCEKFPKLLRGIDKSLYDVIS